MGGANAPPYSTLKGPTLAIHISRMKEIIRQNGHLVLEGNETTEELRVALMHLWVTHSSAECHRPDIGIPIEVLIPDLAWLMPAKRGRPRKNVETVELPIKPIPRGPSLGD